jgi:protein involved in sex pheromone biosynthesis
MGRDRQATVFMSGTEFSSGGGQFKSVVKVDIHLSHWEERQAGSEPLLGDVELAHTHRVDSPIYIALNEAVRVLADGVRINRLGIGFSLDVSSVETYQSGDDEEYVFEDVYDLSLDDIPLLLKEHLAFAT